MAEKEKTLEHEVNFDAEDEVIRRLMVEFELNGVKSITVVEKEGRTSVFDSGISGKAIVELIMYLAKEHSLFFAFALKKIQEIKDAVEDSENSSIH